MRAAIVMACVLSASTVWAQGIGRELMEKMSGPDPAGIEVRFPIACGWREAPKNNQAEKRQRTIVGYWETDDTETFRTSVKHKRSFCIDAGFASFNNRDREDEGFHVSSQRLEAGFTWRLDQHYDWLRAVEPSVTIGAIGFLTDNHREWRGDASLRIAVRLLDLIPTVRNKRWASIVRVTYRPEVIFPGITDEDLGANPAESFDHGWLFKGGSLKRWPWIVLDFSEVAGLR